MQAFALLLQQLEDSPGSRERLDALAAYLQAAGPADGAWAVALLLGRRRRLISARRLRRICLEGSGLPEWLFDACQDRVGEVAETIALLLPRLSLPPLAPQERPLAEWMELRLPALAALEAEAQREAVLSLWAALPEGQCLVVNRLLSGGLRPVVPAALVSRALARVAGLEDAEMARRLLGFEPSAAAMADLLASPAIGTEAAISRPYPFCLAAPLEGNQHEASDPALWQVEWQWDGIRVQLLHRAGRTFLWSRAEELVNEGFPELVAAAAALPPGTVLDGILTVWPSGAPRPAGFASLQRRIGRRRPGAALRRECPVVFLAHDLLEGEGRDLRREPLSRRRAALEALVLDLPAAATSPGAGLLRLSPVLPLTAWRELEALRRRARTAGAAGLMLKSRASAYEEGRQHGAWWKQRLEPLELDAVLLYAQPGSGDPGAHPIACSFGLWDADGQLVTFARASWGRDDEEIEALERWIRGHTRERFGPVRAVEPTQVFTLAFEQLQRSSRHRSGLVVLRPRIRRWRHDRTAASADSLETARTLLGE